MISMLNLPNLANYFSVRKLRWNECWECHEYLCHKDVIFLLQIVRFGCMKSLKVVMNKCGIESKPLSKASRNKGNICQIGLEKKAVTFDGSFVVSTDYTTHFGRAYSTPLQSFISPHLDFHTHKRMNLGKTIFAVTPFDLLTDNSLSPNQQRHGNSNEKKSPCRHIIWQCCFPAVSPINPMKNSALTYTDNIYQIWGKCNWILNVFDFSACTLI